MRRTGFKRKPYPESPLPREPRRAGPEFRVQTAALLRPAPKDEPIQSEAYMAAVRKLPCVVCGVAGYTEFAHADIIGQGGKGKGIKSDCRLGYPACGPHPNAVIRSMDLGCHYRIGTSGKILKQERHQLEATLGGVTRATIKRLGLWPANLPEWPGDA